MSADVELSPLRVGRITGSRVGAILGLAPDKTPSYVLREMVRQFYGAEQEFTGNALTDWGHEHEADGIAEYEVQTGEVTWGHQSFTVHPEYDFLGHSPDGFVGVDGLIEVKCPTFGRYNVWQERPEHHAAMQLGMSCNRLAWADYVVWRTHGTRISRDEFDPLWLADNLPVLQAFHARYWQTITTPKLYEPMLEPLTDERTDREWADAAANWSEAKADEAAAKAAVEAAVARLNVLADGRKSAGFGVQVSARSERRGLIQWTDFVQDMGYDVELAETLGYRAPSTYGSVVRALGGKA